LIAIRHRPHVGKRSALGTEIIVDGHFFLVRSGSGR
jgi:hypothetical protein